MMRCQLVRACLAAAILAVAVIPAVRAAESAVAAGHAQAIALETQLVARHGEAQRERARRGIAQCAALWRLEDGDDAAFAAFVLGNFAGTQQAIDALFARWQHNLEQTHGHAAEISRELSAPLNLDIGPVAAYDEAFAAWDPTAHWQEDLFANKLAFTVLLNFPLTTLEERDRDGAHWTPRQWAETLLAEHFRERIPAAAARAVSDARAASGAYIAGYNIWMHHLVDAQGQRQFPAGKRLLSHWNLRDEIKATYAQGGAGLAKQRTIQRVMERVVAQEIPAAVIDNPAVDWDPLTNAVSRSPVDDRPTNRAMPQMPPGPVDAAREPDTRYARLLANFQAQRVVDRYAPTQPTYLVRAFEGNRQLSAMRVQAMLEQVLGSQQVRRTGQLIAKRLGRRLEAFDIWYSGFKASGDRNEAVLDALVAQRYPDAAAYERDIPQLLRRLGFAADRADYLARHIKVDPARGSGHALGAGMRGAATRLRTRVEKDGMDYKGYNIAVHEMCHNVEQVFSMNDVPHYSLHGVPNSAFTEALAFTCQHRDLELLGITPPDAQAQALRALDTLWSAYETSGVALVDMQVWRWMYEHPQATPAQLREAVLGISKDVWNRWYAPVFGVRDVTLLAIYSHMINELLYLPDYPIGHMIDLQIEAQMHKAGDFGAEFERMARIGAVTPDLWMMRATGAPVGPQALLAAAQEALAQIH